MNITAPTRQIWKSAELLIAFHKNKKRERRDSPFLWRPKEAFARLLSDTQEQEAFVLVKAEGDAEDIQIKLHPDKIVVRRDQPLGWSGLVIEDDFVRVIVDNTTIRISPDGTVKVERDAETTYLEGDGSIIKVSPDAEILVSSDGENISRRTADKIDAISADGIMSRAR